MSRRNPNDAMSDGDDFEYSPRRYGTTVSTRRLGAANVVGRSFEMEIKIRVMKLAGLFIAMTNIGGMTLRGGTRNSDIEAVQSLFSVLAGQSGNTDDALLAVSLGMANTTLEQAQLTSTQVEHDDMPPER